MGQNLENIKNGSKFKNWKCVLNACHMRPTLFPKICAHGMHIECAWNTRYICPIFVRASFTNDARASMRVDTRDSTGAYKYRGVKGHSDFFPEIHPNLGIQASLMTSSWWRRWWCWWWRWWSGIAISSSSRLPSKSLLPPPTLLMSRSFNTNTNTNEQVFLSFLSF